MRYPIVQRSLDVDGVTDR
ncbi:hypothetical protein Goarm_001719, partial [Gossypium armourianum]|nr:hypothetical protein [Gossypium armourianum]